VAVDKVAMNWHGCVPIKLWAQAGDVAQAVERLHHKCEALSLNPSTITTKKKKKKKTAYEHRFEFHITFPCCKILFLF
jgi:hypothetical protein